MVTGDDSKDGTYKMWSYGSDDEEMRNPTPGAMISQHMSNATKFECETSQYEEY